MRERRLGGQQSFDERGRISAAEGMLPGRQFPGDDAEREDVRPRIDGLSAKLFRRHVAGRSERRAGRGQPRARNREVACHSEVDDLHTAIARADHVLGFEIAVHDAALVRGGQRVRHLRERVDQAVCRKGPGGEFLPKRRAVQELRRDEEPAVDLLERVDGGNGRM